MHKLYKSKHRILVILLLALLSENTVFSTGQQKDTRKAVPSLNINWKTRQVEEEYFPDESIVAALNQPPPPKVLPKAHQEARRYRRSSTLLNPASTQWEYTDSIFAKTASVINSDNVHERQKPIEDLVEASDAGIIMEPPSLDFGTQPLCIAIVREINVSLSDRLILGEYSCQQHYVDRDTL